MKKINDNCYRLDNHTYLICSPDDEGWYFEYIDMSENVVHSKIYKTKTNAMNEYRNGIIVYN